MANALSQTSALPEGDRYYLLRGNTMVPLVPADQIPLQLRGLPRQLTHRQMSDENWKLLHETKHAAIPLAIQVPDSILRSPATPKPSPCFLAPDHHVRSSSKDINEGTTQAVRWPTPPYPVQTTTVNSRTAHRATPERPVLLTDPFTSIYQKDALRFGYHTPYPSGLEPDQSKKEFCTHWIKTGECAFTLVGCKYKHEMPTMDKLRELGFTQLPKWWKEKSAIITRGPTWMQRRLAAGQKDGRQVEGMPPLHIFPDPPTSRSRQAENPAQAEEFRWPRTILQEDIDSEQLPDLRVNTMPIPYDTARPDSPITNLLIDFDETPVSPQSPQPSHRSLASATSSDGESPFDSSSTASPAAPLLDEPVLKITPDIPRLHREEESLKDKTALRRESLLHKDTKIEETRTPIKLSTKDTNASRKAPRGANTPIKQVGLANSKHAAAHSNLPGLANQSSKNSTPMTVQSDPARMSTGEKLTQSRNVAHAKGRVSRRTPIETRGPVDAAKRLPA
jgi:hypothetical protein